MLASDWYARRLAAKQDHDVHLLARPHPIPREISQKGKLRARSRAPWDQRQAGPGAERSCTRSSCPNTSHRSTAPSVCNRWLTCERRRVRAGVVHQLRPPPGMKNSYGRASVPASPLVSFALPLRPGQVRGLAGTARRTAIRLRRRKTVAQVSKPAVSPISKSAAGATSCAGPVWKPAIQQARRPALRFRSLNRMAVTLALPPASPCPAVPTFVIFVIFL